MRRAWKIVSETMVGKKIHEDPDSAMRRENSGQAAQERDGVNDL